MKLSKFFFILFYKKMSLIYTILIALIVTNYSSGLQLASENSFIPDKSKEFNLKIQMRNSRVEKKEDTRCSFVQLDPSPQYITEIKIEGIKEINHHISLVGCETLEKNLLIQEDGNSWDCHKQAACGPGESRRIYTWALDAEGVTHEKGVGYKVSGNTKLNYLVINSHYNDKVRVNFVDNNTAYNLKMTFEKLPYQVGVYTLGVDGSIPPGIEKYHMDSACQVNFKYDIVPIFYRTHAHNIIPVISGYFVKKDEDIMKELGRMSPNQPQQFYQVSKRDQIIQKGDILAARCTADSSNLTGVTLTGHKHADEMCVFYLMFYTDNIDENLDDFYCYFDIYDHNPENFSWDTFFTDIHKEVWLPKSNDNLDGVWLPKPWMEFEKN